MMTNESAELYVVATPIGNLGDISARALATLRAASWIAAEDTRHTQGLLAHFGIAGRMLAAHEHNEESAAARIVECLSAGESVALVSDAGTPGVSDPGARIVARVRTAGFRVVPIPGACAAAVAISVAGIAAAGWQFCGFLPERATARREAIADLAGAKQALVFYEAPHRILASLTDLAAGLGGERTVTIARELTKRFESIHQCRLSDAVAWTGADTDRQRGEFVLVVDAPLSVRAADATQADGERVLRLLLDEGLPVKQAVRLAVAVTGAGRNELYARALALRQEGEGADSA